MKLRCFLFVVLPSLWQLQAQTYNQSTSGRLKAFPDKSIMNEDGTTFIEVLANDTGLENGKITVTIKGAPAHGTAVVNEDNTITYSPYADYNGMDLITYQVCNQKNECSVSTAAITINPLDDVPFADTMVITQTLSEKDYSATLWVPGMTRSYRTFAIVKNPAHGKVLTDHTGKYVYFQEKKINIADTIIYQVCDNGIPYFCSKGMIIMKVNVSNISAVEIIP